MGQRLPVRHDVVLRTKNRQHPIAGIVRAHVQGDGPLDHRPDALADGAGRLGLDVPDRREDLQHVGRVDLGDGPTADAGEGIPLHAPPPVLRVPPAAPAAALLFEDALGGLGEGGDALGAVLLRERVSAGPGQHAVDEGQFAGLGERGGAESEFAVATADDEPLDPTADPGRLNKEVQAVAVCVPSWRGGSDEGGRERLTAA